MSAVLTITEELLRILASPGGLKVLQVATDPLATRDGVARAISTTSELAPKPEPIAIYNRKKDPFTGETLYELAERPKGNEMAEIPNSLKVVDGKLTLGVPHPTEAGTVVQASFDPQEIISALMLGLQLFGAGKVVLQSRPADEPEFIKITYVYEGTASQVAAAARQIYTDVKD